MMKASFRDQGIAKVDRMQPGPRAEGLLVRPAAVRRRGQADRGRVAGQRSSGRRRPVPRRLARRREAGAERPRHDLDRQQRRHQANGGSATTATSSTREISFGTIGPSLYNYGKIRGVKDPADPASAAVVQYTWGKLWNSKAYAACSNMPRFGHAGSCSTRTRSARDGAAARPEVAGQPVPLHPKPASCGLSFPFKYQPTLI
jgi:sulfur-oxidizing protein SoxX